MMAGHSEKPLYWYRLNLNSGHYTMVLSEHENIHDLWIQLKAEIKKDPDELVKFPFFDKNLITSESMIKPISVVCIDRPKGIAPIKLSDIQMKRDIGLARQKKKTTVGQSVADKRT